MSSFLTNQRHGYSVKFSPLNANRLVVASSQYFGLTGGGTLYLLESNVNGEIIELKQFQWSDGLFDVIWSDQNENIVVTSSGDGTLQLWDITEPKGIRTPFVCYNEHNDEVYSLDWNRCRNNEQVLSASWDGSIKLWDLNRTNSLSTYFDNSDMIYSAMFSPFIPNLFSSVGIDGTLRFWNSLDIINKPVLSIPAHNGEILTCDWCKFDKNLIATGASDGLIRGFDVRYLSDPVFELFGCEYAVRRIRFSPFSSNIILSCSYDSTTRIWNFQKDSEALEKITHLSELVYGIDWNLNRENEIADCGSDSIVNVFTPKTFQNTK